MSEQIGRPSRRTFRLLWPALAVLASTACAGSSPVVTRKNPSSLSKPNGYTHVVETSGGRTVYVSGQIPLDATGALVGSGDLKAQARQVFENLKAALAASGGTLDDVV